MTGEEIKQECEALYRQIKNAETRLHAIRMVCNHDSTFMGNYSFRPGSVQRAEICSYCNEVIKFAHSQPVTTT